MPIREKKIVCGEYMEVDIYPIAKNQIRRRRKKEKASAPKQKKLNDKNARRYFIQLVNVNFGEGDIHITLTYAILPESQEAGERAAANYLRRVAYARKKARLPPLKYIMVTECTSKQGKPVRLHHHIIMNGGLSRDELEDMWSHRGKRIGYTNADRLKPNEYGLEALARYLSKSANKKKRWSSSKNLKKPEIRTNDSKYTVRGVEKIARNEKEPKWEKKYPGWLITEALPTYNEITGWAIYLKLRRLRE